MIQNKCKVFTSTYISLGVSLILYLDIASFVYFVTGLKNLSRSVTGHLEVNKLQHQRLGYTRVN